MSKHTMEEDFQHFLSYSGLGLKQPGIEKELRQAFSAAYDDASQMEVIANKLRALVNEESMEMFSDTPDFILSSFLMECLFALDKAIKRREIWYGRVEPETTEWQPPKISAVQMKCTNCENIVPINEMYSCDACSEKCQNAILEKQTRATEPANGADLSVGESVSTNQAESE